MLGTFNHVTFDEVLVLAITNCTNTYFFVNFHTSHWSTKTICMLKSTFDLSGYNVIFSDKDILQITAE